MKVGEKRDHRQTSVLQADSLHGLGQEKMLAAVFHLHRLLRARVRHSAGSQKEHARLKRSQAVRMGRHVQADALFLWAFLHERNEKRNGEEGWRDWGACREPALIYVCLWDWGQGSWIGLIWLWDFYTVLHGNKSPPPSRAEKYAYSFQFSTHI